jgi:putative flippase GtrA
MSPTIIRFIKYSIVGFSTFVFDLLLLTLVTHVWPYSTVYAAGITFFIAVSLNYFISRKYVFRKTSRGVKMGYTNFIGIALIGMGIVMGGMYVLTVFLAWNYLISRICIAIVTGLWNYLLNLHVNFKVAGKH